MRRKGTDGPARLLGDAVAERLRARNVDPSSVEWDAWRREDGRWTLVADYRSGESSRHAEFVFDAPGRYVVAEDDEARWLVGEQSTSKGPQPRASSGPRRLSSVDSHGDDLELPLGDDAIGMVSEDATEEPTEDLSATAAAIRETGDADWIATQATERPAPPPAEEPEAEAEAEAETEAETAAEPDDGRGRAGAGGAARDRAAGDEEEEPRVRAELGRDHVRWRQARVTWDRPSPGRKGYRSVS